MLCLETRANIDAAMTSFTFSVLFFSFFPAYVRLILFLVERQEKSTWVLGLVEKIAHTQPTELRVLGHSFWIIYIRLVRVACSMCPLFCGSFTIQSREFECVRPMECSYRFFMFNYSCIWCGKIFSQSHPDSRMPLSSSSSSSSASPASTFVVVTATVVAQLKEN